jgi:hypothetical protein
VIVATAAQVVQAYSEKTLGRTSAAAADRAVNAGQAADLLPKARKGGGKGGIHWNERELVLHNMSLAVTSHSVSIAAAPAIALQFLSLHPTRKVTHRPSIDRDGNVTGSTLDAKKLAPNPLSPGVPPLFAGAALGAALEEALRCIASSDEEKTRLRALNVHLTLHLDEPSAWLQYHLPTGDFVSEEYEQPQLKTPSSSAVSPAFHRTTTIPFSMLEMLADLLADTLAKHPRTLSLTAIIDRLSTSDNTDSLPGESMQSIRPSDEGASETPHTDNRSLNNSDPIPRVCASAIPEAAGGQPPTTGAHHDEPDPGDDAGRLDPDH